MPSAQDMLNSINGIEDRLGDVSGTAGGVNGRLEQIKGNLNSIIASINSVDASVQAVQQLLLWGFQQLITLGQYTSQALFHNNQQNDTMICLLQQISNNTCQILNEAHTQTGLQTKIEKLSDELTALYAATHAEAALIRQREAALRKQIEACCPPKPPVPACEQGSCPAPAPFRDSPPQVAPQPPGGPVQPN